MVVSGSVYSKGEVQTPPPPLIIRSKIDFLRISNISATRSHARLISAQSLKSHEHFSDLGIEITLSHVFLGKTKCTAIHRFGEGVAAKNLKGPKFENFPGATPPHSQIPGINPDSG